VSDPSLRPLVPLEAHAAPASGGATLETCALCLRLCRSACPVATATGREAATPTRLAEAALQWRRGRMSDELAREALSLCTDCGGCGSFCHIGQPLPEALRAARAELTPAPVVAPLPSIEGDATIVAVESDARAWSDALSRHLGAPVARWRTSDALGAGLRGRGAAWSLRAAALRSSAEGRDLVVHDGDVAAALKDAGIAFRWLQDVLGVACTGSCSAPGARGEGPARVVCCGGAGPLREAWPSDARRLAARWVDEHAPTTVGDARCHRWLTEVGVPVPDVLDRWLADLGAST
jgi:hypothetical protein